MMDSTTSEPVLVHSTFAYQTIRTKLFRLRHEQCCDGEVDGSCGERSAKRRKAVLVSPELIKRFEDKTKRMEVLVKVASEEVQIEGGNNESGVAISVSLVEIYFDSHIHTQRCTDFS